jgi:hypothetical protein
MPGLRGAQSGRNTGAIDGLADDPAPDSRRLETLTNLLIVSVGGVDARRDRRRTRQRRSS